jgi:hypothetical protein
MQGNANAREAAFELEVEREAMSNSKRTHI